MRTVFPKVLIIGQYFSTKPGGTITMTHLFHGWDKNNIAVAAENIQTPDFEICNNFYQLGDLERKNNFPFNLKKKHQGKYSGVLVEKPISNNGTQNSLVKPKYRTIYDKFLNTTGLCHYKSRFCISDQLEKWIENFAPDYIYSQLSSLELILFVEELHRKTKIPIAIHIMDDWPSTIGQESFFKKYWQKRINKRFENLLSKTSIFLGISEAMNEEYHIRYGHNFKPFHNPVDIEFWGKESKKSYEINNTFVILYAGRIGTGIRNCFFDVACAIQNLIKKGYNIELQMQITNHDESMKDLMKFDFIKFNKMLPYEKLPKKLAEVDMLLLPNDFEKEAIPFLKYSMPTKASEYMISGTPILLYASKEAAVTLNALKYKWARVVSEKNTQLLEDSIIEILENKELRKNLGSTAKQFAEKEYDGTKIREEFLKVFPLKKKLEMEYN